MQRFQQRLSRVTWWVSSVFACGVGVGMVVSDASVSAQNPDVPWECSQYSPEAQARCMKTLLELQQDTIARLEEQLKAQQGTVQELKEKLDRHEALALHDSQANQRDPRYPIPFLPAYASPYAPPYGYVPVPPIGIYLQPPWRVPRYYGYGPGYWGRPGLSFQFRFGKAHRHRHR